MSTRGNKTLLRVIERTSNNVKNIYYLRQEFNREGYHIQEAIGA